MLNIVFNLFIDEGRWLLAISLELMAAVDKSMGY